jgi:hypothetical protein
MLNGGTTPTISLISTAGLFVKSFLLVSMCHADVCGSSHRSDLVNSFSTFWIQIIATVAAIFFLSDLVESTRETVSFNKKLNSVYEATTELKDNLKEKGITTAHEVTARVRELKDDKLTDAMDSAQHLIVSLTNRINETKFINRYSHQRIMNAFPKMAHTYHQNSLELYKAYLEKSKRHKAKRHSK